MNISEHVIMSYNIKNKECEVHMRDSIYIGHMFKTYVFKINIYITNLPPQDAKTYVVEVIKYA